MIVKFYKKDDKGKNKVIKSLNLQSAPKIGEKVKMYHRIFIVREVCLDLDKVEYSVQL